jgi:hypothetical protein
MCASVNARSRMSAEVRKIENPHACNVIRMWIDAGSVLSWPAADGLVWGAWGAKAAIQW